LDPQPPAFTAGPAPQRRAFNPGSAPRATAQWQRFFRLAAGTAAVVAGVVYAFVVLVDPWNILPFSPPLDRVPVTSNQRFSYPSLARSDNFDSAIFGASTLRLLRPVVLDPEFHARFANLAINDGTVYEISRLMRVFARAHPAAKIVMLGLDIRSCVTGHTYQKLTSRPFPEWMYHRQLWRGYAEMFNLFAVQEAGKALGVLTGLKPEDMGRDGYTSFVPPDAKYDAAWAASQLDAEILRVPPGERAGDPATWRYPALEAVRDDLASLPAATRKILIFVPYNHRLRSPPGSPGAAVWDECKRRAVSLAIRNSEVVDFMQPSPITDVDTNYWDAQHYRVGVADWIAHDLIAADRGDASDDYRILYRSPRADKE
jgi:hypothetical protein